MSEKPLSFIHQYVPSTTGSPYTLLLLHGTGGDEYDLLDLGRELGTGAALLSPRGKSVENGMARFFKRLAMGVFDLEDLKLRTHELADFVVAAAEHYGFDPKKVIALGYSNGANVAASLLLLRPEILSGAILLRAMPPLVAEALPDLSGIPVWIAGGRMDTMIPPEESAKLAELLKKAGADVSLYWAPGGHALDAAELFHAKRWLGSVVLANRTK